MPIILVSTHNQRSDLVCLLITHPLNSRLTANRLDPSYVSVHAALDETHGFQVLLLLSHGMQSQNRFVLHAV